MAARKLAERLPVGSAQWIDEERTSALKIAQEESEDFAFCVRNEAEWLNEHVAEIFSENHLSVKDIFKTPGKLRGKTPHTARKRNPLEARAPLTDVFSATPRGEPSPFRQPNFEKPAPKFQVAQDEDEPVAELTQQPKETSSVVAHKLFYDSGYHGSQSVADEERMEIDETLLLTQSPQQPSSPKAQVLQAPEAMDVMEVDTEFEERRTTEGSFRSANEEQLPAPLEEQTKQPEETIKSSSPVHDVEKTSQHSPPKQVFKNQPNSPEKASPEKGSPEKGSPEKPAQSIPDEGQALSQEERPISRDADVTFDDAQSPSDGSSPIRPIVRKSSLSFASLPAREPLTTKQSIGNRISRTSHLDQTRQSYYGRPTGGKSLGNVPQINAQQEVRKDEASKMELDSEIIVQKPELPREESENDTDMLQLHNKTSTQRLQDQISKLGQSQSNAHRPSKSIPNVSASAQPTYPSINQQTREEVPSARQTRPTVLPGTFPEDEDESWIGPPNVGAADPPIPKERPGMIKAYSAEMMEGVHGIASLGEEDFRIPKPRGNEAKQRSPLREPVVPERTTSTFSHAKSASTSQIKLLENGAAETAESMHKKGISVSNPNLASVQDNVSESNIHPPSPTRGYRDSPLKASKDKLSSIIKFSKNLFASGAALSAEAKSSGFSPASKRFENQPSMPYQNEHLLTQTATDQNLYPTLEKAVDEPAPPSPTRSGIGRKTRASTEREEKRKEKEAKEAQRMVAQLDKLEKAREKEKQKARVFNQEQEKIAAAEKQAATQKEQEKPVKPNQADVHRALRTSPRKTKAELEAEGRAAAALPASEIEEDVNNVPNSMPPPAIPRAMMASQIGKPKDLPKRPGRPLKDPLSKAKQAPMIIRVDTGSQRNQNHPSNSALAASLQASLAPSAPTTSQTGLKSKANTAAVSTKASTNSFSSSVSSSGAARPRALETAARKREQDEREAQRKRDIKLENERKLEEKRQEQQRRKEAERQREREREQLEAKKASQATKQALLKRKEVEMAKQQRPPPPPARPQALGDNVRPSAQEKPLPPIPQRVNQAPPRPASRMDTQSQDEMARPMNMGFHNTTKAPPKRPFQQDAGEELSSRPTMQRSGPSYQQNESKRRRTGEELPDLDMHEGQQRQMAPPIRQSNIRQKDGPTKALFPNGYAHAPQASHAAPSLHKATLQHLHQNKPAHPMDMAQVSKATISFAPSHNQQTTGPSSYKTPARPAVANPGGKSTAKSHAKSSPRYQDGEDINLPEIHTDSEDEDDETGNDFAIPDWADSPNLRDQLAAQDSIDPAAVFGPMPELKMEEIFKNKERWNRFRARTSSANWSGSDRLTEDEIRKDLEGRERIQREGGWTYGLS